MPDFGLDLIAKSVEAQFTSNETIKSFQDYLEALRKDPHKYCRNSAQYVRDVFEHYGSYMVKDTNGEEIRRWKIFDMFLPVFGQERAQNAIYNYVKSFSEKTNNKIILLHGPNGSAKTSLIASIMQAVEEYSKLPEGAVFTYNWIFSDNAEHEVGLGFQAGRRENLAFNEETLAFTPHDDITFKLVCAMKDSPILLIPKPERAKLLESIGIKAPHHLYEAELSQKGKEIFNQLIVNYKGDWKKVIRHVQVERFYFSKLFRKGLVSIDPHPNADASTRPLNLERSYRIPRILAMSSLYEPFGDLIDSNRGICEFSEIFKRSPNDNKYLLTTAERGTINLPGLTAQLDCLIFATDNEKNLSAFKVQPDWSAFNGRLALVKVPYLLKLSEEKKSAARILSEHAKAHVAPHTLDVLALWSVITRLRKSKLEPARDLSHTEKAILYDREEAPPSWTQKRRQELLRQLKDIAAEYEDTRERVLGRGVDDASYEGRGGASYRDIENIVIEAVPHNKEYLSPLTLFTTIEKVVKNTSVYEFVKLHLGNTEEDSVYEDGYLSPEAILKEVKAFYAEEIRKDLRDSAGLIPDTEYDKLFDRYMQNVKAWTKNEKILNQQTGKWETPNEHLMRKVEEKLGITEKEAPERRKGLFGKIANWALKNDPAQGVPYGVLFNDLLNLLKKNNDAEQRTQVKRIQKFMLQHGSDDWKLVPEEDKKQVTQTIDNMLKRGYTEASLKEAVVFLIRHEEGPVRG